MSGVNHPTDERYKKVAKRKISNLIDSLINSETDLSNERARYRNLKDEICSNKIKYTDSLLIKDSQITYLEKEREKFIRQIDYFKNEILYLKNEKLNFTQENKKRKLDSLNKNNKTTNPLDQTLDSLIKERKHIYFCNSFLNSGKCENPNCNFSHKNRSWIDRHQSMCQFVQHGTCKYGNICNFSHFKNHENSNENRQRMQFTIDNPL